MDSINLEWFNTGAAYVALEGAVAAEFTMPAQLAELRGRMERGESIADIRDELDWRENQWR